MFRKISIALVAAAALGSAALAPTSASAWGRGGGFGGFHGGFHEGWGHRGFGYGSAAARAGAISIRTAASGLSDRRQYRDDARPPRRGRVSLSHRPAGEHNARLFTALKRRRRSQIQARVAKLSEHKTRE